MRKRIVQRRRKAQRLGQILAGGDGARALQLIALRLALGLLVCTGGAGVLRARRGSSRLFPRVSRSCRGRPGVPGRLGGCQRGLLSFSQLRRSSG